MVISHYYYYYILKKGCQETNTFRNGCIGLIFGYHHVDFLHKFHVLQQVVEGLEVSVTNF